MHSDPVSGAETWEVKVDSCKVGELIDGYGRVKDANGLAGLLGAKWWPVGAAAGLFFGWAWGNQEAVKSCAAPGTGIKFTEATGIVTACSAQ